MKRKKQLTLRQDAISQGKSVYFTGKPCKNGHIDQRYTSSGGCLECFRLARLSERMAIKAGRNQVTAHG